MISASSSIFSISSPSPYFLRVASYLLLKLEVVDNFPESLLLKLPFSMFFAPG